MQKHEDCQIKTPCNLDCEPCDDCIRSKATTQCKGYTQSNWAVSPVPNKVTEHGEK